jgi:hypothetical protein
MLLYLGTDLLRVVRMRPLVSVAVSGDRYSVGYSVACKCPWSVPSIPPSLPGERATDTDRRRKNDGIAEPETDIQSAVGDPTT